jgi:hypothetical protein
MGTLRKRGNTVATDAEETGPPRQQDVVEESLYQRDAGPAITHSPKKLSNTDSPRSILDAMAEAIRAGTHWFYPQRGRKPEQEQGKSRSSAPSPTKSASSKKSTKAKAGEEGEERPRTAPIDIPRPVPTLNMQFATTPLLQGFSRDHPDMIPSGRPEPTPYLTSRITFQQAMAEAQDRAADNLQGVYITPLGSPLSQLPSSSSGRNDSTETPTPVGLRPSDLRLRYPQADGRVPFLDLSVVAEPFVLHTASPTTSTMATISSDSVHNRSEAAGEPHSVGEPGEATTSGELAGLAMSNQPSNTFPSPGIEPATPAAAVLRPAFVNDEEVSLEDPINHAKLVNRGTGTVVALESQRRRFVANLNSLAVVSSARLRAILCSFH